jgi:hypothetical protein
MIHSDCRKSIQSAAGTQESDQISYCRKSIYHNDLIAFSIGGLTGAAARASYLSETL